MSVVRFLWAVVRTIGRLSLALPAIGRVSGAPVEEGPGGGPPGAVAPPGTVFGQVVWVHGKGHLLARGAPFSVSGLFSGRLRSADLVNLVYEARKSLNDHICQGFAYR
jgi:hypothetical protein